MKPFANRAPYGREVWQIRSRNTQAWLVVLFGGKPYYSIITRVNGEVIQDDTLNRMMFPLRREIEYISTFMTLLPGDIIITGTPTGAGARFDPPKYLKPGDEVEIEVEGIGVLSNGIEGEAV